MPIQLDDIDSIVNATTKAQSPKFFSSTLTGSGKKTVGLLNATVRPGRYPAGAGAWADEPSLVARKTKTLGSNVTTYTIPTGILTQATIEDCADKGLTIPVADPLDRLDVTAALTKYDFDVLLSMTPQGVLLREDGNGDKIVRDLKILYRMEVTLLAKGSDTERVRVLSSEPYPNATFGKGDEFSMLAWSYAPLDDVEELIADATRMHSKSGTGVSVPMDAVEDWMADYDVHERISRLADAWAGDQIADEIGAWLKDLFNGPIAPTDKMLNQAAKQLRLLETYNVSLDAYRAIHAAVHAHCPPSVATTLSKQNLNLLMAETLTGLDSMKPQLSSPPSPQNAIAPPAHFSAQQVAAITTPAPLSLVIAGAGTGKTTVIGGRIGHLESCGVKPTDITVLSFTNAAADNVKERFPQVGSMTIARMIHEIYSLNHPTHELSTIDTILNALDIYYPADDLARVFRQHLMEIDKKSHGSTTAMNSLIERYFDQILTMLDTIKQVCLELEIIIAYQRIDHMIEPASVSSRYLIVDEVQDNSIFEFIYLLKYVAKHRENMFIVGDASQTLYEFRASNPKALNALESSGVFDTFQLTTNYRSNQEILDFANVHLADIEANQVAQLRLQANSLAMPTADTFQEKVTLDYQCYPALGKFRPELAALITNRVGPWIKDRIARGERVAFLAYARAEVKIMEEALTAMFPNEHVANITSDRVYPTTVLSMYVKKYWNDVMQVAPADASLVIVQGINNNLDQLTRNPQAAAKPVAKLASDWWIDASPLIGGWLQLLNNSMITKDEFFANVRENLLSYEVKHNGMKKILLDQKNRERKEKNLAAQGKLVVSTIHGAKGLEFDNVVVLHKFDSQMSEENKRMYYVALTRAMNSEYILSYGTVKKPRIESDYKLIVGKLTERDRVESLRALGHNPDSMSEDEVEAALAWMDAQAAQAAEDETGAEADTTGGGNDDPTLVNVGAGIAGIDDALIEDEGQVSHASGE